MFREKRKQTAMRELEQVHHESYQPYYEGLKQTEQSVVLFNMQFIVRRIVLLMLAIFASQHSWLQTIVFFTSSQLASWYLAYTKPFESRK